MAMAMMTMTESLPWNWILEDILHTEGVTLPLIKEVMTYTTGIEEKQCCDLQKRIALRYLEEFTFSSKINALTVPLLKTIIQPECNEMLDEESRSAAEDLLLRVKTEAVLVNIREKQGLVDWEKFQDALDHLFPEEDTDAKNTLSRKELLLFLKQKDQGARVSDMLKKHPVEILKEDLLHFLQHQKSQLGETFLKKVLHDTFQKQKPNKKVTQNQANDITCHLDGEKRNEGRTLLGRDKPTVSAKQRQPTYTADHLYETSGRKEGSTSVDSENTTVEFDMQDRVNKDLKGSADMSDGSTHNQTLVNEKKDQGDQGRITEPGAMKAHQHDKEQGKARKGSGQLKEKPRPECGTVLGLIPKRVFDADKDNKRKGLEGVGIAEESFYGKKTDLHTTRADDNQGFQSNKQRGSDTLLGKAKDKWPASNSKGLLEDKMTVDSHENVSSSGQKQNLTSPVIDLEEVHVSKHKRSLDGEKNDSFSLKKQKLNCLKEGGDFHTNGTNGALEEGTNAFSSPIEQSIPPELHTLRDGGREEFCLKCRKPGLLISCNGCPVTVHNDCIIGQVSSSSAGNEPWFCPYCTKKKAFEAVLMAEEEVKKAKERLAKFMKSDSDPAPEQNRSSVSPASKKSSKSNQQLSREKPQSILQGNVPEIGCSKEMLAKPKSHAAGSKDPVQLSENARKKSLTTIRDYLHDAVGCEAVMHDVDGGINKDHQINANDGDGHDGDLEEDTVDRKVDGSDENIRAESPHSNRESDQDGQQRKPQVHPKPRGNRFIPGLRRKNLPWTQLEVDTLQEGVNRFSHDGLWGFQWSRILDFGYGKFHASRTAVDLKDKWRNISKNLH